ncbi:MAG: hypothetical protein Q7T60_17130 [Sphingopyxis sp.]|nr:hypothetical protein [Sphingopyxis sp.]
MPTDLKGLTKDDHRLLDQALLASTETLYEIEPLPSRIHAMNDEKAREAWDAIADEHNKWCDLSLDERDSFVAFAKQLLAYEAAKPKEGLKLGSRLTVEGVEAVVVAKAALDWLNGEGDDFERPDGVRGAFWWRAEFKRRAMLSAAGDTDDRR